MLYVVDGTRRDTFDKMFEIQELVKGAVGDVPSVVALNKSDLTSEWQLSTADEKRLKDGGHFSLRTSAKAGTGVAEAFQHLADATVGGTGART
jgi:signal recognition particle receptor subunit beta